MSEYRLVMKGVVKTFPGVKALDDRSESLRMLQMQRHFLSDNMLPHFLGIPHFVISYGTNSTTVQTKL